MSRRLFAMYNIPNVLSTDTVRKKMRDETNKEDFPILHASTFVSGKFLSKSDYKRINEYLLK